MRTGLTFLGELSLKLSQELHCSTSKWRKVSVFYCDISESLNLFCLLGQNSFPPFIKIKRNGMIR